MRRGLECGFTIVELLMAMLIIGILSTIAISKFVDFGGDARQALTREKLMALKIAINGDPKLVTAGHPTSAGFEAHCLAPPSALVDLVTAPGAGTCATLYDPFLKQGWRGPYVSNADINWSKDAWGTLIEYFVIGPPARTIRSCGSDLVCGNPDDISVVY